MLKHTISLLALALLLATPLAAQLDIPAASPSATFSTTVGLTDVEIVYARPSMKGRTIFAADGLVPFDKMWRTGANSATKVSFADEVMIGDQTLDAGQYAVLTKPGRSQWAVYFYPYESSSWGSYIDKEPAATYTARTNMLNHAVETFTISINHQTMDGAHLTFAWDKTMVAVPIRVNVKDRVMSNIERVMAGPSANEYFAAAGFLLDNNTDLNRALEYAQKANSMVDSPRFWYVRREALIHAALGDKGSAVEAAQRSMQLAREAGNDDYVRLNQQSILEWGGR